MSGLFAPIPEQDIVEAQARVEAASKEAVQLAADMLYDRALAEAVMRRLNENLIRHENASKLSTIQ